jgi:hypothetical protein
MPAGAGCVSQAAAVLVFVQLELGRAGEGLPDEVGLVDLEGRAPPEVVARRGLAAAVHLGHAVIGGGELEAPGGGAGDGGGEEREEEGRLHFLVGLLGEAETGWLSWIGLS